MMVSQTTKYNRIIYYFERHRETEVKAPIHSLTACGGQGWCRANKEARNLIQVSLAGGRDQLLELLSPMVCTGGKL